MAAESLFLRSSPPSMMQPGFFSRFQPFLPLLAGIITAIALLTLLLTRIAIGSFEEEVVASLKAEIGIVVKMFERERDLKAEKVRTHLRVVQDLFYRKELEIRPGNESWELKNQENQHRHTAVLPEWYHGGTLLNGGTSFVDHAGQLLGGTVTVFQRFDSGFVRIQTNVLQSDSSRAVGTFIPSRSPVAQTVQRGENFYGRAYVVNDWYITAYEPILRDGEVAGMLYVGVLEKDLGQLRSKLSEVRIGSAGQLLVFDESGELIARSGGVNGNGQLFEAIRHSEEGVLPHTFGDAITVYRRFRDFGMYIAARVVPAEEYRALIRKNILLSLAISLLTTLGLSAFVYFHSAVKIQSSLERAEASSRKLDSAREALRQAEDRFRILFNSASDEIFVTDLLGQFVEVNEVACNILGYNREELLGMRMHDIKTPAFAGLVDHNLSVIREEGRYTYETEHRTRSGQVICAEMKSRLITYHDDQYVLSVARNITERRETERRILSAVIQAEERERERFSKDMHDGLGPMLSTIKLYIGELSREGLDAEARQSCIHSATTLIDEVIDNTRTISNNLMPRVIHEYGLKGALEALGKKIEQTNRFRLQLDLQQAEEVLDKNTQLILFRVISELINNSLRHSGGNLLSIRLAQSGGKTALHYSDNGRGFDASHIYDAGGAGMGLKNIATRIKSINGIVKFESREGEGMQVHIEI
jgi:PAS domain S-box-containing protein